MVLVLSLYVTDTLAFLLVTLERGFVKEMLRWTDPTSQLGALWRVSSSTASATFPSHCSQVDDGHPDFWDGERFSRRLLTGFATDNSHMLSTSSASEVGRKGKDNSNDKDK